MGDSLLYRSVFCYKEKVKKIKQTVTAIEAHDSSTATNRNPHLRPD